MKPTYNDAHRFHAHPVGAPPQGALRQGRHPSAPALPHLGPLSVASPLRLSHTSGGRLLSMQLLPDCAVIVRITAVRDGQGMYDAVLVLGDDSDGPKCAVINVPELASPSHALLAGQTLIGVRHTTDGDVEQRVLVTWPDGLFKVELTEDGGADANAATNQTATWTYTVKRGDAMLGEHMNVVKRRPLAVQTTPGIAGLAYYEIQTGQLMLWEADEQFAVFVCS